MGKRKISLIGVIAVFMLLLAACSGGTGGSDGIPQTGPETVVPGEATLPAFDEQSLSQVQSFLEQQLGVTADQVSLGAPSSFEWQDSCLGAGRADESCAQVMTPGYSISATVNGQVYEVRTNQDLTVIRLVDSAGQPVDPIQ